MERELIQRFGVSSIPIREALLELESRGLVTRRHNCGCSVIQLRPEEAARICELWRVLEPKMMERAAVRITPAAIERQADADYHCSPDRFSQVHRLCRPSARVNIASMAKTL